MAVLEGVVANVRFRNDQNGFTVLDVRVGGDTESVVGVLPFIKEGERARFTGEWGEHRDFGIQFSAQAYETLMPTTALGIERYLAFGGIKGIGPATARDIVRAFGEDTFDIMEYNPERLSEVPGIGKKRAAMIADSFKTGVAMRNAMLYLQRYDISPLFCMRIIKKYGSGAQALINENPYRMIDDIEGMGFKTCDGIAMRVGLDAMSQYRLCAGIRYALLEGAAGSGHVFIPYDRLLGEAAMLLGVDEGPIEQALVSLLLSKALVRQSIDGEDAVYLPAYHAAECDVALGLTRATRAATVAQIGNIAQRIGDYERKEGIDLHAIQREALVLALTRGVVCLTGGPGTGKTTIIRCILQIFSALKMTVIQCAPTGRAAKRMAEATGADARTVHRVLEYTGQSFARDESNMLECDAVIVDEMSMMDVMLMRSLLKAIPAGARLVLVGDADQLPSVGAGSVLGDILKSGVVPSVRLTEIFRQAQRSLIVRNAHRINRGEALLKPTRDDDFFIERAWDAARLSELVVDLCARRLIGYAGLTARDIQVLAPMKRGEAGVYRLNTLLQDALNPAARTKKERRVGEGVLREGDRVMQVRNNYALAWEAGDEEGVGVFNGEMGVVEAIDEDTGGVTVIFDDARRVLYDASDVGDIELAYAVTVHKSQGSEFPCVVMPVLGGPPQLLTRNLLYTAVTRARRLVVLAGREEAFGNMIRNNAERKRYSGLCERLRMMGQAFVETLETAEHGIQHNAL